MKNKLTIVIVILLAVFALQTIWVQLVRIFWDILYSMSGNLQMFLLSVVLCPIAEEVLWRYTPLELAKKYFPQSIVPIVIASSILFGLAHDNPFPFNILVQGFLGVTFSFVYMTLGLRYSIFCHALWNLSCFIT
jgi:membrane protease YdiL (CAAX protease family)